MFEVDFSSRMSKMNMTRRDQVVPICLKFPIFCVAVLNLKMLRSRRLDMVEYHLGYEKISPESEDSKFGNQKIKCCLATLVATFVATSQKNFKNCVLS